MSVTEGSKEENIALGPSATTSNDDGHQQQQQPSILEIMIEKHSAIEKAVSLVKEEIAEHTGGDVGGQVVSENKRAESDEGSVLLDQKFDGLTDLLADSKVKAIIKSVAGEETNNIVDVALGTITASSTTTDKQQAFKTGIKKIHSNLSQSGRLAVAKNDPVFSLAMSLVGLNRAKLE